MHEIHCRTAQAPIAVSAESVLTVEGFQPAHADTRVLNAAVVALGLLVFAVVWLPHLAFTSLSPPFDNIEQLTWVQSLQWGYYKHPPLPTWLIWLPAQVFGATAWIGYVLGAALTLGSMWILWQLLSALRGITYATVALLAALCITYYNGRLNYYNHDIVLTFLAAASAALCWQAFASRRLRWWAALGLVIGLGALSKYQIAVTMVSILVFAWHQRAWREPIHRMGILLACLIALILFAPHLYWLRDHDFGPIQYAVESSLGAQLSTPDRFLDSLHWLADQVLNRGLPALLLLGLTAFCIRRRRRSVPGRDEATLSVHHATARAFLLIWGIVPLLFMPLVGIVFGADLQLHWGAAFLHFAVPAVMEIGPVTFWGNADLGKVLRGFVLIQALLLLLSHATSPRGPVSLRDHSWRTFDSAELAYGLAAAARSELGGPVRVVSGEMAEAGALALQLPERPLVLIDGRFDRSPWVSPDLVRQCGMLELGTSRSIPGMSAVGAAFPGLVWRVIKPQAGTTCPR